MRTKLLISLTIACVPVLFAQPPGDTNSPWEASQEDLPIRKKMREKIQENLPPELRERCDAARTKALQDPIIQELKKKADASADEFRKAMREAIRKGDPDLAEIIKKEMRKKSHNGTGNWEKPPDFHRLSESDRKQLITAREIAKMDPEIQALKAKKEEAKTPEERRAAAGEFHQAMKSALLKIDPTLAPILNQLHLPEVTP